jgi:hypothetical protein
MQLPPFASGNRRTHQAIVEEMSEQEVVQSTSQQQLADDFSATDL